MRMHSCTSVNSWHFRFWSQHKDFFFGMTESTRSHVPSFMIPHFLFGSLQKLAHLSVQRERRLAKIHPRSGPRKSGLYQYWFCGLQLTRTLTHSRRIFAKWCLSESLIRFSLLLPVGRSVLIFDRRIKLYSLRNRVCALCAVMQQLKLCIKLLNFILHPSKREFFVLWFR